MYKFEFVAVTGGHADNAAFEYFDNYLISLGEPLTSPKWDLHTMVKHAKKILKHKVPNKSLFLDSGGYQIITDYVKDHRLEEMVRAYHFTMEKLHDKIDYIFALDVNKPGKMSEEEIYRHNKHSMELSLKSVHRYPDLLNKQIFIWQTRNPIVYKVWNNLYDELDGIKQYKRWSFGGLVGFKLQSGAKFSPFVPAFCDFMVKRNAHGLTVDHVHFLGQSSMLAIFTAAILQNKFGIKHVTLDSSELVRHTPIQQKMPLFHYNGEDVFWIKELEQLRPFIGDVEVDHIIETSRMRNKDTFMHLVSMHVKSLFDYARKHAAEIGQDIELLTEDDFLEKWPILNKGRFYKELKLNNDIIKSWIPLIESGDISRSREKYTSEILTQYKCY